MPDGSSSPVEAGLAAAESATSVSLRILATTDLHMNLGAEARRGGLARLAPLIAQERAAHANLMLFDNGDLLDGTPLGDELATAGLGPHDVHPAISALNRLGYDAATLGNHDFAHGVAFLRRVAGDARYPLVLTNAGLLHGAPIWTETALLHRQMTTADGAHRHITVGVFGVLPPQTVEWESGLSRDLTTEDILIASRRAVSSLRARGADVIVALSHGGLGTAGVARAENAAGAIAEMTGVHAVIAGHTHEVIVRPATPTRAPIVKAGFGGSHLAAITLQLDGQPGAWHITCTGAEALAAQPGHCDAELAAIAGPRGDISRLHIPVGQVGDALSSHYAMLGADAGLRLTEAALRRHLAEHLPDCALPVLTAAAPFRTGGRGGPDHFVHIPAGPVSRGDLSALYPFTNHVAAVEITGAGIAEWLERAASIFTHLPDAAAGAPPRPLLDASIPGFHFDMIGGLDYEIDLRRPAAFDAAGQCQGSGGRVGRILHQGQPLHPNDRFLLLTNSYRLAGGPLYAALTRGARCLLPAIGRARVRDIIARHLSRGPWTAPDPQPAFRLGAAPGTTVWFDTAPEADPALCPLPVLRSEITESGFQRLTLRL